MNIEFEARAKRRELTHATNAKIEKAHASIFDLHGNLSNIYGLTEKYPSKNKINRMTYAAKEALLSAVKKDIKTRAEKDLEKYIAMLKSQKPPIKTRAEIQRNYRLRVSEVISKTPSNAWRYYIKLKDMFSKFTNEELNKQLIDMISKNDTRIALIIVEELSYRKLGYDFREKIRKEILAD